MKKKFLKTFASMMLAAAMVATAPAAFGPVTAVEAATGG